jgi:hypothetical protein
LYFNFNSSLLYLCCCWQVEVAYSQIAEIRTAPRAFDLWGDCVIFLKNGDRLVGDSSEPAEVAA